MLRVVGDFFIICPAFGQNEIEYPKQSKISDTYYQTNYTWDDADIDRTIPVSFSTIYTILIPEISNILEVHPLCSTILKTAVISTLRHHVTEVIYENCHNLFQGQLSSF
jgi:hypothetical protein